MGRVVPAVLVCLLATIACRDRNHEPTLEQRRHPALVVSCVPAGVNVSCAAYVTDTPTFGTSTYVTSLAVWIASDSSVGGFVAPGSFAPTRRGEVGLTARYHELEEPSPHWFLVDPSSEARWLYELWGHVTDRETGVRLPGAEVRVLDGHARGAHATTNSNGYYVIEKILVGETFSAQASKDGYESLTQTYRVDPPVVPAGSPSNPNYLEFRLQRTAQAAPP